MDVVSEANKIGTDSSIIIDIIQKIYPTVESKTIKTKLTKIKNKINNTITETASQSDTSESLADEENMLKDMDLPTQLQPMQ